MYPAPFPVVLDANVLFPLSLRDTLLRAAQRGLYRVHWSMEILEETRRNLVRTKRMSDSQGQRLVATMQRAFPSALVTGYEHLTPSMPNDPKDRHVVAAAVKIGAQVVVTNNLKDFAPLPDGLEAQSPDTFLCGLLEMDPTGMGNQLRQQVEDLDNPPMTMVQLLNALAATAPEFAAMVGA